jgi:AcrR family transcriptional regulator
MTPPNRKRSYRSAVRDRAAAETRRSIVAAASEFFLEYGFAKTTTKAVAARAGVTERMIFLNFGSKAALLAACIRAAVRDSEDDLPMLERSDWRAVLAARNAHEAFSRLATAITRLYERAAPLLEIGETAARDDPLLAEQRRQGHAATRADLLAVARAMKRAHVLRHGISPKRAADVMFALAANEGVYLRLVRECGWTPTRYETTLRDALIGALADP